MAGSSMILREFFVALGFKVDEGELRNLEQRVEKATQIIEQIGEAATVSFAVVDAAIIQTAKHFADLHYVSEQTGSSVKNIQAFQYGMQQVGIDAAAATSMVEGLARTLRDNPGKNGLLNAMGVKTEGRETTAILDDTLDTLAKMQPYLRSLYGAQLGFNPDQLNIISKYRTQMKAAEADRRKMISDAGLDPDKVAGESAQLGRDLAKFDAHMDILKGLLVERFLPMVERFVAGFDKAVEIAAGLDKKTGGASTYIGGAGAAAITGIGGIKILRAISKRLFGGGAAAAGEAAAAGGEAAAVGEGAVAAGGLAAIGPIAAIVAAVIAALGLGYLLAHTEAGQKLWDGTKKELGSLTGKAEGTFKQLQKDANDFGHSHFSNPMNLRAWGGTPQEEAFNHGKSIGKFAHFASDSDGLNAMAAQLLRYQDRDKLRSVRQIINKLAPPSENDTAGYIKQVSGRLGVGADDKINLHDPEMLSRVMDSIIRREQGKEPYGMSTLRGAADYQLGKGDVANGGNTTHIEQNNEINVHGSSDPNATARSVVSEQRGVGRDLVRNLGSAPS